MGDRGNVGRPLGTVTDIEPTDEGAIGCRTISSILAVLLGFAVVAVSIGLALVLGEECSGLCETAGLTLYAAGAPVSGLFAVLAGELPLAYLTDIALWIAVAAGAARIVERRRLRVSRVATAVIGVALVYGLAASAFLERV
jgi:hypothetical protein